MLKKKVIAVYLNAKVPKGTFWTLTNNALTLATGVVNTPASKLRIASEVPIADAQPCVLTFVAPADEVLPTKIIRAEGARVVLE